MYVYESFEPGLWTVGSYRPDGTWYPESDQGSRDEAAWRVAWLNGSPVPAVADRLTAIADWIEERLGDEEYDRQAVAESGVVQLRELAMLARRGAR